MLIGSRGCSALVILGKSLLLVSICLAGHERGLADSFDVLRLKWHEVLTGGTNLDLSDPGVFSRVNSIASAANSRWSSMNKDSGRTFLWSDAARTNQSEDITTSYLRLKEMALGWAIPGSVLCSNAALAADILDGLEWMYANRYNENKTKYDNWWDWEIGSPMWLNDCMVLMYPVLSGARVTNYCNAIDKFTPSVTMTGANRIWKTDVVAVRGVVGRNAAKIAAARDGLSDVAGGGANSVFKYATSGDGFYRDGSFIQHNKHPYTAGYGISHFHDSIKLVWWLAGSPWAVTDPQSTNIYAWARDSYEPLIYRGAMPAFVRGREIARVSSAGDYGPGRSAINGMLLLAQSAPPEEAAWLKSAVKYWDQADTLGALTSYAPLHLIDEVKALLADTNVVPRGELVGHYQFPAMDRVMHLRPGFGFGLAMFSTRIYNYESINTENLKGWYTADGTTWVFNDDLAQFTDAYWPTVDPYHLPGTTVDTIPRGNSWGQSKTSSQNWVGGCVLEGAYGVAGMAFKALDSSSSLALKKSWFMFDDEVVCLGSDLNCGGNYPVHTTVENRRLNANGSNALIANGVPMSAAPDWSSNFVSLEWCTLEGAGGYYFPGGAPVEARRYSRTGRWYDINILPQPTATVTNPITRNYLSLVVNHRIAPANQAYSYVLLPNQGPLDVSAYAADPDIQILENSSRVHAVREKELGVLGANFWNSSPVTVDFLTCNTRASVLCREAEDGLAVAVSDPTQTNSGTVIISLERKAVAYYTEDTGISIARLSPTIEFVFRAANRKGRSGAIRFLYETNRPPVLLLPPQTSALAGATLQLTNVAFDPDTPPQQLRFELIDPPPGAWIDSASGVINWRPTLSASGTEQLLAIKVSECGWSENLVPLGDAFVRDGSSAALNFGSETNLSVKSAALGLTRESYLSFQVPPMPGSLRYARLALTPVSANLPGTHAISLVTNAWEESSVTWNSRPGAAGFFASWLPELGATSSIDLSAPVQPLAQSGGGLSLKVFALTSTADGLVNYGSREGYPRFRPALELGSTNHTTASATGSIRVAVVAPQPPRVHAQSTGHSITLTVAGDSGLDYQIQTATNLVPPLWVTAFTAHAALLPFQWIDPKTNALTRRFYRVVIATEE